uniref:JAB domain-containing protein n=1 Tax=Brucepastera parasyntrophica TaxID=2880008 RepID=UPI0021099A75|nr:JAB domain-containing protein [Brucepastera parasyntrophica]ULQ60403.1 DNA repair protein RadC [Brucepastera parasyntrophica]
MEMQYQIVSERKSLYPVQISAPADVYAAVRRYAKSPQEQFIVLTLNGAHEIITVSIVTIGIINRTIIHPREVFIRAIRDSSAAVILAHNHPSGQLEPSPEDLAVTVRLMEAGELIGIPVLDHIIFGKKDFVSLREKGHVP